MAFVSVNQNANKYVVTRKWKEFSAGESFVATFEDVGTHKDKFGKDIYSFKVIESNFGKEAGEMIHLNTGGNFVNLMNEVSLGDKVRIEFKGTAKISKGKWANSTTYDIDVQLDQPETSDDLI